MTESFMIKPESVFLILFTYIYFTCFTNILQASKHYACYYKAICGKKYYNYKIAKYI